MNKLFFRALTALLAVFAYVAVHECGHALAAVALGRTVTNITFVSLKPQVLVRGPVTATEQAIAAVAGSGLVLALWFLFMSLRRARPAEFLTDCVTFLAAIELLAWFLSACTHALAPANNDVTKFINHSGSSPAVIASFTGMITIAAAALYSRRTRPAPCREPRV